MDTTSASSKEELGELRRHGFVLHNNRVIFDAQPPLSAQEGINNLIGYDNPIEHEHKYSAQQEPGEQIVPGQKALH
jgi:hypothetical protein